MRKRIFAEIAADLEKKVRADAGYKLPSISELTEIYHVAYHTMWKAMQVLIRKGVLSTAPGKKIAVSRHLRPDGADDLATSTDKLYAIVKDRIESGDYKVGKPLPKIDYFVVSENVSHRTVTRVLRRLAAENLAYRHKRRWTAGPHPARSLPSARLKVTSDAPVVLVLYYDQNDWSASLEYIIINAFLNPFINELFNHRILIEPCFRQTGRELEIGVPTGMDEIIARAKALGSRYIGALTMGIYPKEEELQNKIAQMLVLGKPVLYFDSAERGEWLTRRLLSTKKNFFRLHQDERSAVELALSALTREGHRTIGIPKTAYGGWWAQRRTDAFEELARQQHPHVRIVTTVSDESVWGFDKVRGLHEFTTSIASQAGFTEQVAPDDAPALGRFRKLLVEKAPSLSSLLLEHGTTAFVGLNDRMAREYYFWLKALGIDIPRQLSLIAFDNSPESTFFPISTVDWGFERLGYLAAHIFIGDLQVRADRQGNIPGVCRIADRWSIGRAGDPADVARLLRM